MPLDPGLVGHETSSQTGTIATEDIGRFADAIGDNNPLFRDAAAAERTGFPGVPVPPTFVTRFRVSFADAGLDPTRSQVLHGGQEYEYARPVCAGETLSVRHRVASIRQSGRGDMAVMTLEQLGDAGDGTRVATGRATVIVRDGAPSAGAAAGAAAGGATKGLPKAPAGEQIPSLTKHVTQVQIDAYADVSGDHNPIHIDPQAARAVGLDGTIAHGMLSMAFLGQLLTDWLTATHPGGWVARLRVRFQGMVRPGDMLTCRGALGERTGDRQRLSVWIDNQHGERVVTGDADVALPGA
jgi:acyl dehydratase